MAYRKLTRAQVLIRLRRHQGKRSVTALAVEMRVSPAYLYDVMKGARDPGPSVLRYLGLEKQVVTVVTYRKLVAA